MRTQTHANAQRMIQVGRCKLSQKHQHMGMVHKWGSNGPVLNWSYILAKALVSFAIAVFLVFFILCNINTFDPYHAQQGGAPPVISWFINHSKYRYIYIINIYLPYIYIST